MNTTLDIAIVGGGVSGVYSAWRLQQHQGCDKRIALFEYSNRIGGRLYSRKLPGLPNVVAELGGMRFIPESHLMVDALVGQLGLKTKNFPMGSDLPLYPKSSDPSQENVKAGSANNLFYLRGHYFRFRDFTEYPDRIPYKLTSSERGYGPEDLQVKVMNLICPGFADMTLSEQMKVKINGKEIWRYGFWNLLEQVLSNEAYLFMKEAGGYDANVANASAVTQLPATEYSDDTTFLTLEDGFQALPLTLCEQFEAMCGCLPQDERVNMNHRLVSINIDNEEAFPYELVFQPTTTCDKGHTKDACRAHFAVRAKQVILAMPRRSLELIESPFFNDPWLKENLPSVLIQKAIKMFMAYEQPWWRSLGLVAGRSVTDLPIRQTYYMGTECDQFNGEHNTNSLLMASYNDIGTIPYWKGLESGEPYLGYRPAYGCEEFTESDIVPRNQYQITHDMVIAAHRQVEALHDQKNLQMPYSAIYQQWGDDPYGGGWHEWKANYRLDEIICRMRHPVKEQKIYIIGEAYSYEQGWVEGALNTAESTLAEFFTLPTPNWVVAHKNYNEWKKTHFNYLPIDCGNGKCSLTSATSQPNALADTLNEVTEFAYEGINHEY
ncbi:amine oxidoreductase [Vibrio navarrensis]|uniref:Tryptophan 2-monooxygenase n=1 Tax=Vibrio navarrensis TaxID=29495 RepID=A0AAJ4LWK4_9VIBR|nr:MULTISPECIES: FAD-dependent oxidoreductase [Vibrio]KJR39134.1 amine oxidoreductase [Vibrio sp. S234-5]MBE3651722.1 amine oxidoreductase [Vibrio navarrensis]MBE3655904.1 amine oxidoreductase [Vibrio navarrensis]MBE3660450.1 amine oxidoreductase [Vibrio navarrensis]MBE4602713.1 amine oxidoreductase [Vibrio navarrensis]